MKEFPQIFAFYSFKGGVGRSMAVLNLAYALAAKGRHVLVLDMDLEAPGLSGFLHREKEISGFARCDMVDLVGWASSAIPPLDPLSFPSSSEFVVSIPPEKLEPIPRASSELGRLDIIPVEEDRDYYDRLTTLGMGNYNQNDLVRTGSVLRAWLKNLRFPIGVPDYYGPDFDRTSSYDYVLVDSRTGITETGGLCIGPLSDQLVVLSALNDQNVRGTRNFLEEVGVLKNSDQSGSESGRKPYLIVASLLPTGEIETKNERLKEFEKALGKAQVKLSYHPRLALKETIFTQKYPDEYLTREYEELLQQLLRMADDGDDPDLVEKLSRLPRSSPKTRDILTRLVRNISRSEAWLYYLLSITNFTEISDDTDYVLWDRVCRVLSSRESPSRLHLLNNWAALLFQWSLRSTDPVLAALRLEAARSCSEKVLQDEASDSDQKALALFNRGVVQAQLGYDEQAISDYTAAIHISDAPADRKALALSNRGIIYCNRGETERANNDFTAAIDMLDASAETRAKAHLNRGAMYGQKGETERAITDYTAVINMPNISVGQWAQALCFRGATYGQRGETERAIADCTMVIEMAGVPADHKAKCLLNRGVAYGKRLETGKVMADYTAVIEMAEVPADEKAQTMVNRGWLHYVEGRYQEAITDARQAISQSPNYCKAHGNLGIALLLDGQVSEALAAYDTALDLADLKNLEEMTTDLREAIEKHGPLPGAEEAMARQEARREALSQRPANNDRAVLQKPVGSE